MAQSKTMPCENNEKMSVGRRFIAPIHHTIVMKNPPHDIIATSKTFFQNPRTKIAKAERRDKCRTKFCD